MGLATLDRAVVTPGPDGPHSPWQKLPFRGALLNTLTVLVGSLIGLGIGSQLPKEYQAVALTGIGLVTVGIAMKMFFETKNVIVIAASVALGGVLGKLIGIDVALASAAEWTRHLLGGTDTRFNDGLITATVLFCVGPMTLMGCLQDGLEKRIDLLGLKSLLDGISATFLAAVSASFGKGVLASAVMVLIVQTSLTALARPLQPVAKNPAVIGEATAAGGAMMLAIGFGLLRVPVVEAIPKEVYLPALIIAPTLAALFERKKQAQGETRGDSVVD